MNTENLTTSYNEVQRLSKAVAAVFIRSWDNMDERARQAGGTCYHRRDIIDVLERFLDRDSDESEFNSIVEAAHTILRLPESKAKAYVFGENNKAEGGAK